MFFMSTIVLHLSYVCMRGFLRIYYTNSEVQISAVFTQNLLVSVMK